MKIFIFERATVLTGHFNSEGGLVVIAGDKEKAEKLLQKDPRIKVTEKEWEEVDSYVVQGNPEPCYWVFHKGVVM